MKATAKRVLATLAGRKELSSDRELPSREAPVPAPSLADAVTSPDVQLSPFAGELYRMIDLGREGAVGFQSNTRLKAMAAWEELARRSPARLNAMARVMIVPDDVHPDRLRNIRAAQGRVVCDLVALAGEMETSAG